MSTFVPYRMNGVALITGAGSGIGRATAHTFVKEGCTRLVLSDINEDSVHTVAAECKKLDPTVKTLALRTDVTSESDVQNMVDAAVKEFGAIHYAINNAGITSSPRVRTHELETSSWERVVDVNLRGVWFCQRAELRQMMKQEATLQCRTGAPPQRGAIVNLSSVFGHISHPTVGAYSATKCGVLGMSRTDAIAYGKDGIRVNSVLPGFVKTPLTQESIRRGANYDSLINTVPIQRWGHPEEIAEAVVFLASEKASLINGEELVADGGKQFQV